LGIAVLEDKIVQQAVVTILNYNFLDAPAKLQDRPPARRPELKFCCFRFSEQLEVGG
jgi:hypothetical protein